MVARRFGQIPQFAESAASALYVLAAPSAPEEAIAEALGRAAQGEIITHAVSRVGLPSPAWLARHHVFLLAAGPWSASTCDAL
jgi:hypothetical protein